MLSIFFFSLHPIVRYVPFIKMDKGRGTHEEEKNQKIVPNFAKALGRKSGRGERERKYINRLVY